MIERSTRKLGRYEIRTELGHGGFGTVYKAWDPALEIEVALKVLDPHLASRDPALVQGFLREARVAAGLNHPDIIRIYDVGEAEGTFYIAMRYLSGPTLAGVIRREAPMSVAHAVELLQPVAKALDYAHARDLVHRDVKPANIIFDAEGRPVLVDFGLVRAAEGTTYVSLSGRAAGTVQYAAPEQLSALRADEVGPATDVYALGVVAYQMLTGQVPFDGETTAVIGSQLHDPPPPPRELNPDISEEVEVVLLQALAKEQGKRPQSAGALVAGLAEAQRVAEERVRRERKRQAVRDSKPEALEPYPERRPLGIWIVAVFLLGIFVCALTLGALGITLTRRSEKVTIATPQPATITREPPSSTPRPPTPTPVPPTVIPTRPVPQVTTTRDMNVRFGPGTNYNIIGTARAGNRYVVIGRNPAGTWWQIVYNGQVGWVFGGLVIAENAEAVSVAVNIPEPPPPTATAASHR